MVVALFSHGKVSDIHDLEQIVVSAYGLRFQSMVGWLHCGGHLARQSIHPSKNVGISSPALCDSITCQLTAKGRK